MLATYAPSISPLDTLFPCPLRSFYLAINSRNSFFCHVYLYFSTVSTSYDLGLSLRSIMGLRSSSYGPRGAPIYILPSTDRTREQSARTRRAFVPLGEEDYRREQRELYPPDGYYCKRGKMRREDGRKVTTRIENRAFSQDSQVDYDAYERYKVPAEAAYDEYHRQRNIYRGIESRTFVPKMYEHKGARGRFGNPDRSEIYFPKHHRALRQPSDIMEDNAYE